MYQNEYYFNKDENLNHNSYKSNISISSDLNIRNSDLLSPRIKIIFPLQIRNSNKNINEDSEAITFNYQNQYSENRFFGNDLYDSSPRIVYGIENYFKFNNQNINFNINQSYETNFKSTYSDQVNQNSKFSDYAFEASYSLENILFKIDSRFDRDNLSKKEMNYSLNLEKPIDLILNYNETQSEAFKNLSNDTQSINFEIKKN